MNKSPMKSKTMQSMAVIVIIALMNLLGIGEEQIGQTYDTITDVTGTQSRTAKDIGLLLGSAGVAYGRFSVKKGKDDE